MDIQGLLVMSCRMMEKAVESALRPRKLDEFIGQKVVCEQLSLLLQRPLKCASSSDHVLLAGVGSW